MGCVYYRNYLRWSFRASLQVCTGTLAVSPWYVFFTGIGALEMTRSPKELHVRLTRAIVVPSDIKGKAKVDISNVGYSLSDIELANPTFTNVNTYMATVLERRAFSIGFKGR